MLIGWSGFRSGHSKAEISEEPWINLPAVRPFLTYEEVFATGNSELSDI